MCAGKPASEPTEDYVRGAALAAVKTLQDYVDEGNEVKGRNFTLDRGYGLYELVEQLTVKFKLTVICTICSNRQCCTSISILNGLGLIQILIRSYVLHGYGYGSH